MHFSDFHFHVDGKIACHLVIECLPGPDKPSLSLLLNWFFAHTKKSRSKKIKSIENKTVISLCSSNCKCCKKSARIFHIYFDDISFFFAFAIAISCNNSLWLSSYFVWFYLDSFSGTFWAFLTLIFCLWVMKRIFCFVARWNWGAFGSWNFYFNEVFFRLKAISIGRWENLLWNRIWFRY